MINRINHIKNFGSFVDFNWNSIRDFDRVNLFFGWNYSGKTTLSRIFSSFERCENYHAESEFSISLDGIDVDESNLESCQNIRVFNTDFIARNIRWNDCEADPFAIIGEESNELKTRLLDLESQSKDKNDHLNKMMEETASLNKNVDKFETDVARRIKQHLSIPNYDRRKLAIELSESQDIEEWILSDDDFDKFTNASRNGIVKNVLSPIQIEIRDLNEDYKTIDRLCQKVVSGERIQRLIDDEKLGRWVEEGLHLHEGYEYCRFCGSKLNSEVLEDYHRHFSDEYSKLLSELKDEKKKLSKIDDPSYIKDQFYPELETDFIESDTDLKHFISKYNESIDILTGMIDNKIENIFDVINLEPFCFDSDVSIIKKYNDVIDRNSKISEDFQKSRNESQIKIKHHIIASEIQDSDYLKWKKSIPENNAAIHAITEEISALNEEIKVLKDKISDVDRATNRVNSILQDYFYKDEISLRYENENFYLYRQGVRANNLSEGEQTAIAFSYFLARLEDTDLSKLIVFIDDPISSLDSNHLFLTYSLICNKFGHDEKLSCDQLFISTHNHEFFVHLKEHFISPQTSMYLIKRINNGTTNSSTIEDLPDVLKKYSSEYVYLFGRIVCFRENPSVDFDQLYDLPNIVRKILETYCQFRFQKEFKRSGKLLFDNISEYTRVYKFVNHRSHSRIDGALQFPELSECREIVEITLDTIKNKDREHYDSITEKINHPNRT